MKYSDDRRSLRAFLAFLCLLVVSMLVFQPLLTHMHKSFLLARHDLHRSGEFDTALIGNSLCMYDADPEIIEAHTGKSAFNLSVSEGRLEDFYVLAKEAISRHACKTVVLLWDPYDLYAIDSTTANESPYTSRGINFFVSSPLDKLEHFFLTAVPYKGYMDRLFPWRYLPITSLSDVKDNLLTLLGSEKGYRHLRAVFAEDPDMHYIKDGFFHRKNIAVTRDVYAPSIADHSNIALLPNKQRILTNLRDYCLKHDCRLLIAATPWHSIKGLGDAQYRESIRQMEVFCDEHDIPFFDFLRAKPEYLPNLDAYMYDWYHLTPEGSKLFSHAFGSFLKSWQSGESVASMFYSEEEYRASVHHVVNVWLDAQTTPNGVVFLAGSNHGTDVLPEYRFVRLNSDGSQTVLSDWSPQNHLTTEAARATIRVYAKAMEEDIQQAVYYDLSYEPDITP